MTVTSRSPVLVWFRRDLRIADNPALAEAAASGSPVAALYVLDDATPHAAGAAALWWLHGSLEALERRLGALGVPLVLRRGDPAVIVPEVARACGAGSVVWNRCYEPHAVERDTAIKTSLIASGLQARSFNAGLLFEPWEIATRTGGPFRVFTPFWRACMARQEPGPPLPPPTRLRPWADPPVGEMLDTWRLRPTAPDWAGGLRETWEPGEDAAEAVLDSFMRDHAQTYDTERNIPGLEGTSRLSPYLAVGSIGPRRVWHAIRSLGRDESGGPAAYLRELIWREFSYHLLWHNPGLPGRNLDPAFDAMPWRDDEEGLRRWQNGATGYPLVDAGMRQLWATGWMHNRVRMVVASFLTKHLLVDWREGARWFWDTLIDADLANNSASWQWVAGCGADAAPFFRIFNPVAQGERFDSDGTYVRRWVPDLAALPDRVVHRPWTADAATLARAAVRPGVDYPPTMVDHAAARARALQAWQDHVRHGRDDR